MHWTFDHCWKKLKKFQTNGEVCTMYCTMLLGEKGQNCSDDKSSQIDEYIGLMHYQWKSHQFFVLLLFWFAFFFVEIDKLKDGLYLSGRALALSVRRWVPIPSSLNKKKKRETDSSIHIERPRIIKQLCKR
jgi:hypothetical protein